MQFAEANPRLTSEAKWNDIDKIVGAWAPDAERIVTRVKEAAAKWQRDVKKASQPPPPTSDETLLEAK